MIARESRHCSPVFKALSYGACESARIVVVPLASTAAAAMQQHRTNVCEAHSAYFVADLANYADETKATCGVKVLQCTCKACSLCSTETAVVLHYCELLINCLKKLL